jgi:hypothetical protein
MRTGRSHASRPLISALLDLQIMEVPRAVHQRTAPPWTVRPPAGLRDTG